MKNRIKKRIKADEVLAELCHPLENSISSSEETSGDLFLLSDDDEESDDDNYDHVKKHLFTNTVSFIDDIRPLSNDLIDTEDSTSATNPRSSIDTDESTPVIITHPRSLITITRRFAELTPISRASSSSSTSSTVNSTTTSEAHRGTDSTTTSEAHRGTDLTTTSSHSQQEHSSTVVTSMTKARTSSDSGFDSSFDTPTTLISSTDIMDLSMSTNSSKQTAKAATRASKKNSKSSDSSSNNCKSFKAKSSRY
jgi:hypothetical protein